MLPNVEIKLSPAYNHILADDFSYEAYMKNPKEDIKKHQRVFVKFQNITKKFQKELNKNQKLILQKIEKYSGYKWKIQHIPVYLVNMTQKPSFADPLTLKFRDNIDLMLILVIHELTHLIIPRNLQSKAGWKFSRTVGQSNHSSCRP